MNAPSQVQVTIVRKDDEIQAITLSALTVDRFLLRQLPVKRSLFGEEFTTLQPIGWVDGATYDPHCPVDRVAVVLVKGQLCLIEINHSAWGREFTSLLEGTPQIIILK